MLATFEWSNPAVIRPLLLRECHALVARYARRAMIGIFDPAMVGSGQVRGLGGVIALVGRLGGGDGDEPVRLARQSPLFRRHCLPVVALFGAAGHDLNSAGEATNLAGFTRDGVELEVDLRPLE